MAKLLIFSDVHVHAHKKSTERLHDCLKVVDWVFTTAAERNIKNIIFAGDLYQDRQKIDVMTYALTFDMFQRHCKGQHKVWLLLGNHDLWYYDKWDISSVSPLSALPGVTLISKNCTLEIADQQIDFMPYLHNPIELLQKFTERDGRLLFGHLALHGAKLNTLYNTYSDSIVEHDSEMMKVDTSCFVGWRHVFLGHYHNEQRIDNVEYVGSPLQLNFGEAFQHKHLIVYDTETGDREYIRNKFSPQHFIIPYEDIDKYELENNFLQVHVKNCGATSMVDIRREIEAAKPRFLEIIPVIEKSEAHVIEDAKSILEKEDDMLENYVKEVDAKDLDKARLIKVGKKVCSVI